MATSGGASKARRTWPSRASTTVNVTDTPMCTRCPVLRLKTSMTTPFIVALIKATMKGVVMLVLSRKTGQRVHIGVSVTLTVVEARDGQVRLAFDAPPEVAIDREEVRQRKRRSRRSMTEDRHSAKDLIKAANGTE